MDPLQLGARGRPLHASGGGFQLPSSSSSESDHDPADDFEFNGDDLDLPFPAALSRKDFLAPTFDATAYLSSLFPSEDGGVAAQRHQTLEDLRDELRERSSAISAELLELVNANYTSFLGLGDELKGGDDQVEDVRVALFGLRRSLEDVQMRVRERRVAVAQGCADLQRVRASVDTGRRLLELEERVAQLEEQLSIAGAKDAPLAFDDTEDEEDEDEDDDEVAFVASGPRKLDGLARDLLLATRLAARLGHHVPFVKKADERLAKCESTLLLDLNAAVKEARTASQGNGAEKRARTAQARLLKLLGIYRVLDREDEIVRVLKEK